MTLASDRSLGRNSGPREIQRTLRVGVGGATGRVSRERSSRIGAALAQEAAGTLLRSWGDENLFLSKSLGAGKRGHRLVTMPVIQPGRGRLSLEDFFSGRSSLCVRVCMRPVSRVSTTR